MMGFINFVIIIVAIAIWIAIKLDAWKSDHRTPPPGYKIDRTAATNDIIKYGENYYHEKHNRGGYDIPEE